MDHKYVLIILFSSSALSKYVSWYTCADTFFVSSTESYNKSSSEALQSWSYPTQAWILVSSKLKEVLFLCNTNFFFSRIVSYGSPVLNLILGIGMGFGVVPIAASVKTRLDWDIVRWKMIDDHLSPAAESFSDSPQKLDRRKSHFHAVPRPPLSMVRKHGSNDELISLILRGLLVLLLRTGGRFEVWQFCRVCW